MIKVAWDVEELVALIDVYRKSDGKTSEQIEKELIDRGYCYMARKYQKVQALLPEIQRMLDSGMS